MSPQSITARRPRARLAAVMGAALAAACLAPAALPAAAYQTVRTTELVNVRAAPNLSGSVVGQQAANTTPRRIRCAGKGQQIYDTNVWLFIDSDALSGFGGGWMTAYYTDAEYDTFQDLQDRYGIARCDRPASTGGGSVYYQPRYSPGDPLVPYTTYTATKDWWAAGSCAPTNAAYWPATFDGAVVTRTSAWSLGRLGVTYLLAAHPERAARLDTIVLFDPGNLADYRSDCDQAYDQDGLMAKWLAGSSSRRLLVLAGEVTRDAGHPDAAGRLHQGIQQYLLPAIRTAGRSSQVLICNYDKMSHPAVLSTFSSLAAGGSATSCPGTPNRAWRP